MKIYKKAAFTVATILAAGGALLATSLPAAATGTGSQADPIVVASQADAPQGTVWTAGTADPKTCQVTDTGVLTVTTPGQHHDAVTHEEWRFQTRTQTFGWVEHKFVSGYNFVDGGTTKVNGKTVSGHWVASSGWHAIADSVINAVWGAAGIPDSVLGGSEAHPKGNVNLSVYGGPNKSVPYYASKVQESTGFTAWGPFSDWSMTNPGASTDTMNVEHRVVTDKAAYDDPATTVTTYYSYTHKSEGCNEPPTNKVCTTITDGPVGTNVNNLWTNVDTRSAGHYEYLANSLHVYTDDNSSNAKVSLGTAASFPLKDTGQLALNWTGSTPPPGINLFVTFAPGVTGTLVYESVYGQDLWLTNGSSQAAKDNAPVNGGGNGSQWHGTIDQWLSVYPDAQVTPGIAFSLGSGVLGDGEIHSITVNCTNYTFAHADIPVTVDWNLTPTNPTCTEDGALPALPTQEHVTFAYDREFDGPGTYTASATADAGYVISGPDSQQVTVDAKTGYQSKDANAPCYVEVPPNSTHEGEWQYTVTCDNKVGDVVDATREVTETTYTLNTVTGEVEMASSTRTEEGTHVVTEADIEALNCTTPPPPNNNPPTKHITTASGSLPVTGPEWTVAQMAILAAFAAVVIAGGATLAYGLNRRRHQQQD